MGQKTSPIGFRTGITLGWVSTWFAHKENYGIYLVEDQKIRAYCEKRYNERMPKGAVAKVEIVRTRNEVNVTLHSARPGVVIGPRGAEVEKIREELQVLTSREVAVKVIEIKEPDLNAKLVALVIAEQLGRRASYRRTMKQHCENAMSAGAKGVKIIASGRLGGAEMSRKETQKLGSIPLHTLDANVDYATTTARTTYGAIGIKVWIYKGKFGEEIEPVQRRRRRPRRDGFGGPSGPGGPGGPPRPRPAEKTSAPVEAAAPPAVDGAPSENGAGEGS